MGEPTKYCFRMEFCFLTASFLLPIEFWQPLFWNNFAFTIKKLSKNVILTGLLGPMIYGVFNSTWLPLGTCKGRAWNGFGFCQSLIIVHFLSHIRFKPSINVICDMPRTHFFSCLYIFFCNSKLISTWVLSPAQIDTVSTSSGVRGHYKPYSRSTVSSDKPLLSCNARTYLGRSLCCCQSNEGQQLWWQISFDKLNDPKEEKSVALIATGE